MTEWATLRTVICDKRAEEFLSENSTPGDRLEDQWNGIAWLLCRTPQIGLPRHKDDPGAFNILVFSPSSVSKTKEIWALYSYSDGEVVVHALRFAED